MDMRTYSAAGTKLSERSVEFVRMDGEGNRPPLDQRRLAHSIQPSDALLRDGDGAGVSAQTEQRLLFYAFDKRRASWIS